MLLRQRQGGTAEIVGPVVLFLRRYGGDMPLCSLGELQGGHLHYPILLGGIGNVNTFVDGQTGNLSEVMVGMGANGTDTVGTEGGAFGLALVYLKEFVYAIHISHTENTEITEILINERGLNRWNG